MIDREKLKIEVGKIPRLMELVEEYLASVGSQSEIITDLIETIRDAAEDLSKIIAPV